MSKYFGGKIASTFSSVHSPPNAARRLNLPLGHQVEVWLCGGSRLRGLLRLREEMLIIQEEHVRHLELLVPGDEVLFVRPEGTYVYAVTQTEIVTPDAMRIIEQTDGYTATLFACHPVGSTKQRIVVHLALTRRP